MFVYQRVPKQSEVHNYGKSPFFSMGKSAIATSRRRLVNARGSARGHGGSHCDAALGDEVHLVAASGHDMVYISIQFIHLIHRSLYIYLSIYLSNLSNFIHLYLYLFVSLYL